MFTWIVSILYFINEKMNSVADVFISGFIGSCQFQCGRRGRLRRHHLSSLRTLRSADAWLSLFSQTSSPGVSALPKRFRQRWHPVWPSGDPTPNVQKSPPLWCRLRRGRHHHEHCRQLHCYCSCCNAEWTKVNNVNYVIYYWVWELKIGN